MIKYYFQLQFTRQVRKLRDFGVNPIFASLAILALFVIGSNFLMAKTEFGGHILLIVSMSWLFPLTVKRRNDFLKSSMSLIQYFRIRIIENTIISIPILIVFLVFQEWILIITLLFLSTIIAIRVFSFSSNYTFPIPRPFSEFPFEFSVGLRKTYLVILGSYILLFIAIKVGNPNLGVFSLLLLLLTCISFYGIPENEIYVWVYKSNAKKFLFHKMKFAVFFSSLIIAPTSIFLLIFFKAQVLILACFIALGYVFLLVVILLKYSTFPREVPLPKGLLVGFSLLFPPLLLALIPYFYNQSIRSLKIILHD